MISGLYETLRNLFFIIAFFVTLAALSHIRSALADEANLRTEVVVSGLEFPWAGVQLPDYSFLITEKPGRLWHVAKNGTKTQISGLPSITARRQGGLLDVAIDPDFKNNNLIYISYVARGMGGTGTEVGRGVLNKDKIENFETIFAAVPKMRSDLHFGSRLAFGRDGTLFITLGERFRMDDAQDNTNHLGTVIRIHPDGSVPQDNPFVTDESALDEIYSYGHRNAQGIDIHPESGAIYIHEHGPQGGDEINIIRAGANYGWPVVTYGIDYDGSIISNKTEVEGMAQPLLHWTPSIAPSGMAFYTGDLFPEWKNDIFVGALAGTHLRRVSLGENTQNSIEETYFEDRQERIRDVFMGEDGHLYILNDSHDAQLMRVLPAE